MIIVLNLNYLNYSRRSMNQNINTQN